MARALPRDVVGTGLRKVVVVHGWLGDRTSFDSIRPYLDTAEFSYAFVDLRGYGDAVDEPGEFTVDEAAGDVLATADELGWQDFSLIGHSMGGAIAQYVLVHAAERVSAIVGISPVPATGVPFDKESWQLFVNAANTQDNRRAIIDLTTGHRLPGVWLDAMVRRSIERSVSTAVAHYLESWAHTDIHEKIQGTPLPTLVFAGAHDPALSPEVLQGTWLEHYPNAELETLTDAGHYAPDELPLTLVSKIESFLTRED